MPKMGTSRPQDFVAGNHFDKYGSRNRLHRALVGGFVRSACELVRLAAPASVLEVGCGGGELAACLFGREEERRPIAYVGVDISPAQVEAARARLPGQTALTASAYNLPFPDGSFDLVMLCEVLEHLDRPPRALDEAVRVSRAGVLVSVPWEPVWRILNLSRGKYWPRLGNTPGHVQHFSRHQIRSLVESRLTPAAERRPFPWSMILGRRRPT